MKVYLYRYKQIVWLTPSLLVIAVWLWPAQPVAAHGGVVFDSGVTDHYEWAASLSPYPLTPGAAVISLLIYDSKTGGPALDFEGEVYLAEPGDSTPCCQAGVHRGPFPLLVDKVLYPGDYSAYIPLDAAGKWQAQFVIRSPQGSLAIVVAVEVDPPPDNRPIDKQAIADDVAMLTAAVAMSIQAPDQPTSPLSPSITALSMTTPLSLPLASPLATPGQTDANTTTVLPAQENRQTQPGSSGLFTNVWLWGGTAVGVIGIVGLLAVLLRSKPEEGDVD